MNFENFVQNFDNDVFGGHFDPVSSTEAFDSADDFQNCMDFDSSVFNDEDDVSITSSLCAASKKISKLSSENNGKRSQKRSKRGRNPWTSQEDAKLSELMKKYGQSWAMISSCLPGRSGKQVRDRYLNKLRPNIKLGDWSLAEDELLVRLCREVGNRWSLIATHLPGRTEGQVKNRYYSYIKKRLQPNGTLSQTGSNSDYSRNISETSSNLAASPVGEGHTFDFRQEFDLNASFMNNGFVSIPSMNSSVIAKGPFVGQESYSDIDTNNTSVASYSPMASNDPADLISYDAPVSAYCRQFSQVPSVNQKMNCVVRPAVPSNGDQFFAPQANYAEVENERLLKLNQRKALLEMALADTLKEINGF